MGQSAMIVYQVNLDSLLVSTKYFIPSSHVTFQMEGTGKNDKQQNRRWGEMTDEATAFYPMPRPFCPDTANDHPVQ